MENTITDWIPMINNYELTERLEQRE